MDATPLDGLRVLDLGGGLSSTYAAKVLNDLGAGITFVEGPAGDPARASGDLGIFRYFRAGTRSLQANPSDGADRRRIDAEIEAADLVLESFGRAAWTALDVSPPRPGSPQVRAHISPYGWEGPAAKRAATGFVLQAASGWLDRLRNPAGVPMQVGGDIDQLAAGVFAAAGSLVALFELRRRREPVDVHVSRFECLVSSIPYPMVHHAVFEPHGWSIPRQARQFPGLVATADGWVIVSPLHTRNWNDLCEVIGVPEFVDRLVDLAVDDDTRGEFLAATRDWFARQPADELVELCQALRIPAARAADAAEIVRDPQVLARGSLIPQPGDAALRPRPPWRFSRSSVPGARPAPDQDATCAPPPRRDRWSDQPFHLGTAEGLSSWGGGRPGLPCSGLRVLDLTAYWAGPYMTSFLASQGADVLKIESHRRPDGFRYSMSAPELGDAWWEYGAAWISTNLGKRSVTLDLQSEQGRGLVRHLVSTADVLVENFTPRVLPHLGLDPEELLVHHPSLVILRMPGFGLDGPARDYVGWAPTLECAGGMAAATGEADDPPIPPSGPADPLSGMHAAVALLAALADRQETGRGQIVEVAQLEVVLQMSAASIVDWTRSTTLPRRLGNRSARLAPQGAYRALGDDEWLALSVRDDDWETFTELLGREDWHQDSRFDTAAGRLEHHDELDRGIRAWTRRRGADVAAALLQHHGIPAAPIADPAQLHLDPQLRATDYFQRLSRAFVGELEYPTFPVRTSHGPVPVHARPAPTLGEHTVEVLRDVLGVDAPTLADLQRDRIIGTTVDP